MDKDMKILITGATGLVGSAAVEYFTDKGWDVTGIDNNGRASFFGTPDKSGAVACDIRDRKMLALVFERGPFDAIIHTAGQPSHDYSKEHVMEDFEINTIGTLNLLEIAKLMCPEAVFVHCSSDKVYGMGMTRQGLLEGETRYDQLFPFTETTPIISPMSPFGVSKLAADFYVQEYANQDWLQTGVFRMGCITGKNHEGAEQHGFLAYLTKCIKEGRPYTIFGFKGKQVRDQIHANDLVSAFAAFIDNPKPGQVYNMGGGPERSVSVLEAGEMIAKEFGKTFAYTIEEQRFGDRQWDVHDMTKFMTDYPAWQYRYSLEDIIKDLCAK